MDNIESTLYTFGIEIKNDDGSYRCLYDVLKDASKIYEELNNDKRKLLKETIMGTYCSEHRFNQYMKEMK